MSPEHSKPEHYKFDLFLRYHRAQARWARQLAERLDREGFRVWFDRWMLQPGDNRKLELQLAIEQSRWIALVVSPEFVGDPWPKDELYSGFPHAPPRQNQRLLALLHTPVELPRPIAEAELFDFTGTEEDAVLFEYRALELMHFLDPRFAPPGALQRFRLQYRRSEPLEDEELRGFQGFLRAIQAAIMRIASGEIPSATPEEGVRQITILQFIQRLFQWNSADIQFERGEEWRKRGNWQQALAAYDRALNMDPNFALAWSRRGDVLVRLARYREAVDSYNGSLSINPYDEITRLNLALILGRLGQYKSAVVNYDKVLESNPEDALAWHNRGIRLLQLKRPKLALNSLNKALRYNPKQPRTWLARGIVLRRLRRPSSAAASFARVLKLNPKSARVWRFQGNALLRCNRLRSAIECYKRSLRLRRRDPVTLHNLGIALMQLGQYRLASNALERALRYDADNVKSWYARGVAFQKLGYLKEACIHFEEALKINPDYFPARYALALAQQELGQHEVSLSHFKRLLQQRPSSFACGFGQVTSLRRLGRWEEALSVCQQMIRWNDRDPWGWFALGLTYSDQGDPEKAIQAYSRVLQLTPDDAVALNNRAWESLKLENLESALADALKATQLEPNRPSFWHTLGLIQLCLGQLETAQASLQRCLELDPHFQPAQAALQDLHQTLAQQQEPRALPELETLSPQPEPQPVDRGS